MSTENPPFLIVYSIGNPEPLYNNTRHSVGHYVLNRLQESLSCQAWQRSGRLTQCTTATTTSYPVILLKSQTSMNVSGPPIAKNWQALKRQKQNEGYDPVLVILHDELSLPIGKTQVRARNASPRGHNGLKSIRSSVGGNFLSIAVGIDRPESRDQGQISKYVSAKFSRGELETIDTRSLPEILDILEEMLEGRYVND